jgi:hypothetical protein
MSSYGIREACRSLHLSAGGLARDPRSVRQRLLLISARAHAEGRGEAPDRAELDLRDAHLTNVRTED